MKGLFDLFKKAPEPQIGDIYVFDNGDPLTVLKIEILDIDGGWVLYKYVSGYTVYSKEIDVLKRLWKKETN